MVDGNDDAQQLNAAAYELALTGSDLAIAEEISRKGIHLIETRSAAITTAEVNSQAFADANELIASWDTLGWILFHEDKLEDARPFLAAGWLNSLMPEPGDHLGQLYEALGNKQAALTTYRLAAAAAQGTKISPEVQDHITSSIARLNGVRDAHHEGTQALQDLRTYKISRPQGLSGWGTFRLHLNPSGVVEAQQMSGDGKLAAMSNGIHQLKFLGLVPPGSQARLLRSAVVSCSMGDTCELVLVPNTTLQTE